MSITDKIRSESETLLGGLAGLVAGWSHLVDSLAQVLSATAGTWFPALSIGTLTIGPHIPDVLEGSASPRIMLLVAGGAIYLGILGRRTLKKADKLTDYED